MGVLSLHKTLLIFLFLLVAGCASTDAALVQTTDVQKAPAAELATASPGPAETAAASPSGDGLEDIADDADYEGAVNDVTGEVIGSHSSAIWSDIDRKDVIDAAETALRAFARPDVDYDEWWQRFGPLLAPDAVQAYAYVDNTTIPVDQITGGSEITDDTSAYVAVVAVPTNIGIYEVTLSRIDGDSPWLVHRLTPPQDD